MVKREKAELEPHSTAPTIHESDATQVAEVGGALPPETGGNAVHEAGLANEIHKLDWKRYHDP